MSKYTFTDEQFINAIKTSFSIREALCKLGLSPCGGSYKTFSLRVKKLDVDTSHFLGKAHLKGRTHNSNCVIPLSQILVSDSKRALTHSFKKRIIKEGLLKEQCEQCGIGNEWQGKRLVLQIDHINGNHFDHTIENLRLLCPNCHSQTHTYCRTTV